MYTADLPKEDRQLLEYAEKIYERWTDLGSSARMLVTANLIALAQADAGWNDLMIEGFFAGLPGRVEDIRRRREGMIH